jgi:hypothetical protein
MRDIQVNSDEIEDLEIKTVDKPMKIAKSTGKPDKRSITSKENAKKAGQIKLAKKKQQQPEIVQYQVIDTDISDSSSDEDNVLVLKQKSKKKKNLAVKQSTLPPIQNNFDYYTLKNDIIQELKKTKKKSKPKVIKVVAPTPTPAPAPIAQPEQLSDHIKKKLLNF